MSQISDEKRVSERIPVMIIAEVSYGEAGCFLARIRDISNSGMRIATREVLLTGTRVAVNLPRLGRVEARVAWRSQGLMGLAFHETIDIRANFAGMPGAFMAA